MVRFPQVARICRFCAAALVLSLGVQIAHAQPRPSQSDPARAATEREQEYRAALARAARTAGNATGEDVQGRDEWFTFQRRFPYDVIPAGAFTRAVEQTEAMERDLATARTAPNGKASRQAGMLSASTWQPIGPVNIAGRIPAVAHHPTKAGVIFIGTASGGVWKSTDDGVTWTTTFDKQQSLAIGALAIDYTNPNVIYAGTGEAYPHSEEYRSHGIYKSTDEGATWQNVGLTTVGGFSQIWVHRGDHRIVYAAATKAGGGFYRSDDSGAHWTSLFQGTIYCISVNARNNDQLYIGTDNGIYYSRDRGQTFQKRTTGLNVSGASRVSVAVAPTDPSRLYALVARPNGSYDYADAYISSDSAHTWQKLRTFEAGFFNMQGFYDNGALVSPDNADIVLVLGIDCQRSDNAGVNFLNTTDAYFGGLVHPDQHAIEFDPKDHSRLLLGNDGGLFRSVDSGQSWVRVSFTLPITQFYKMDVNPYDANIVFGGAQDNGSLGSYGAGATKNVWNSISGGDGFYVACDPNNPAIVYSEIYYGSPLYRNDVGVGSSEQIDKYVENYGDKGDWSTPLVLGLGDGAIYSGRHYLWRTRDGGGNWERLVPGTSGLMSAVAASPANPKIIVGTNVGDVRYSINDGANWARSAGIPARSVEDLRYDPSIDGRIYACISGFGTGHVFRSDNDGATFTDITGNLPDGPFNCVCPDPSNPDRIFAGTDFGVFVTFNGGKLWLPLNEGMPRVPVVDLKIHVGTNTLIAATHGRSMFKLSLNNLQAQPVITYPLGGATYQTPGPLPVRWYGINGPARVQLSYDGVNFNTIADGVTDTMSIALPAVRSSNARVRVVGVADGLTAETDDFLLVPRSNGTELSSRAFVAEALEYRRGWIWATQRGSDSISRLQMPLLGGRTTLLRTGIPGHVRDMAYDSVADRFYLLVTADDHSGPHLYRMDTNGVGDGEVTLPAAIDHASGVAMTGQGIAVVSPGAPATVWIINDSGNVVRTITGFNGNLATDRRSLAYNDNGLVQGVVENAPAGLSGSTFQRAAFADSLRIAETIPAILSTSKQLQFVGIAIDNSAQVQPTYVVSDTAGTLYKFTIAFAGVDDHAVSGTASHAGVAIGLLEPNPFRSNLTVHVTTARAGALTLDLYRTNGERVARVFDAPLEAGEHALALGDLDLASGLYILVATTLRGERDARSVVVVR